MGLRLPLDSLPYVPPSHATWHSSARPDGAARAAARLSGPHGAARDPGGRTRSRGSANVHEQETVRAATPRRRVDRRRAHGAVRRAREGRLHVFMPPVERLEDYLDLVAAIEATAAELEMPVMIEGYPPPYDYRLQHFKVTPDPGVIEVNTAAGGELEGTGRQHHDAVRRSPPDAAGDREVHARRPAHRHRRRQSHRAGRADAGRQPVPAPARPAAQPGDLLEQPSVAVVFVLRPVHRARRARPRASTRPATRALYELEMAFAQVPDPRSGGTMPALAGRSPLPQSAGRPDGQHAPGGVLHRQAVFARQGDGPAGAGRVPRVSKCRRTRG